jgi:hypothetical protein
VFVVFLGAEDADERETSKLESSKQSLSKLQDYVGDWRGVGQVKRGSTRGAWRETCGWAWKFDDDGASLVFKIEDAKFFDSGLLRTLDGGERFELTAKSKNKKSARYTGAIDDDGVLRLTALDRVDKEPARLTLRQVADGKRMLILYEKQVGQDRFSRLAEVGYTRKGSNFGKGTNYVECVVTGGVGTIAVTHQGKTYYVCCTGCRDYFNEDPAGALAEYRERKEEEKRKADTGDS